MISQNIYNKINKSSWIRAMFEEGAKLRKIHGAENVYDFSLGNPDYEPPVEVKNAIKKYTSDDSAGLHRYMSNAGHPEVREKIAKKTSEESGLPVTQNHIIMTCGAAGGLNVVLKSILNPEDEVIVFSPYFVEYLFYIENCNGKPVVVPADTKTFEPSLDLLARSITSKCKAIIINSPNNPTGVVYSEETLKKIAALLVTKETEFNSKILVISDEPYSKIVYDQVEVPSILKIFKHSAIVNSYSKSLAIPGERVGYIAVNPSIADVDLLINGMIFCNRTLGFVNAPSLFQKVIADSLDTVVNTDEYKRRRDFLYNNLIELGYSCVKPQGAFYLFPQSLIPDDIEFAKRALKYNLLIVPGSGFGCPGYFRLAYCVDFNSIKNSIPAFKALAEEFKGQK
ncbi:aspartate aminotransferase [Pelosinus fermentans]|uniref:Aminotransferase n=1 Tax=Pelosinus fermentans B4 TaxID=1149862 RepID=I9LFG1_9FIRM|nr:MULTISPECIES: pyridoxal phosphate-dependent aminotransferase [Pelosinus]EIW19106.1 aminotransferase class I and II [Pelosinus fermentans B4]OAM95468.1 Aspartate transaminase [Pelosinus fermentans DSM 17108]SDR28453.1 aspartate aminotransferase [Pelosinus fermentans]